MEILQELWEEYGTVITAFFSSGIGAVIVSVITAIINKANTKTVVKSVNSEKIITEVTSKVTKNITDSLSGSIIDVDLEALVSTQVKEAFASIETEIASLKETVEDQNEVTGLVAKAMSKSKLVDAEEKATLAEAGEELTANSKRRKKKKMRVRITSAETTETTDTTEDTTTETTEDTTDTTDSETIAI